MANRYWVGGTGTWNYTSTVNWSTTSGGSGGASVPGNLDDVFFDSNSGSGTCTIANTSTCKSFTINSGSAISFSTSGNKIDTDNGFQISSSQTGTLSSLNFGGLWNASTIYMDTGGFTINSITPSSISGGTTLNLTRNIVANGQITLPYSVAGAAGPAYFNTNGYNITAYGGLNLNFGGYSGGGVTADLSSSTITANIYLLLTASGNTNVTLNGTFITSYTYVTIQNSGAGSITNSIGSGAISGYTNVTFYTNSTGPITYAGYVYQYGNPYSLSLTKTSSGAITLSGSVYNYGDLNLSAGTSINYLFHQYSGSAGVTKYIDNAGTITYFQRAGSGTIYDFKGAGSIGTLNLSSISELIINASLTTSTLNLTGASPGSMTVRAYSGTSTLTANSSFSLSNITWQNITAAGTIPFTGTGFVDGGGNTNIQFYIPGSGIFFGSNF